MKLHRNAKTTPLMRRLILERVTRLGWTARQSAEAASVSVRTVAKWRARGRAGDTTLLDRSSRPARQPRRLAVATAAQIVQLRHTRATAWQISAALVRRPRQYRRGIGPRDGGGRHRPRRGTGRLHLA
jgi:transposase